MNKKTKLALIISAALVIACLLGVLGILIHTMLNRKPNVPPIIPTATEPSEEPSTEEPEESVVEEENVPDTRERLGYVGNCVDSIEIYDGTVRNRVLGLSDVFKGTSNEVLYSIEQLLTPYVKEVYNLNTELPKVYTGEMDWRFADKDGYPGQIVLHDRKLFLYYYNPNLEDLDEVIQAGFPATSYGYIQPEKDNYRDNELCNDLPEDEAFRVLSALTDGEGMPTDDDYYLIRQRSFNKLHYFSDNAEVKAYKVNRNLGDTFIEVYLTRDKYYTIRSQQENYKKIIGEYLYRNSTDDSTEVEEEVESEDESDTYSVQDFRHMMIAEYVWDNTDRGLWESVSKIEGERVQQILQYALERNGETSCEFVGETAYINGYRISNKNVYIIQLTTNESSTTDYYISVTESAGSAVLLPVNATPRQ